MNYYQKWFFPLVLLGMLLNFAFGIPALFFPSWILGMLNLPATYQNIWLRDAGLLLICLTITYYPAAIDPIRYKVNAVVLSVGRLAFGVFWFWFALFDNGPSAYFIFGAVDFFIGLAQVIVIFLLFREEQKYLSGSNRKNLSSIKS